MAIKLTKPDTSILTVIEGKKDILKIKTPY